MNEKLNDLIRQSPNLAAAIREVIGWHKPQTEPQVEEYDDTEEAYNNGQEIAAWEFARDLEDALRAIERGPRLAMPFERLLVLRDFAETVSMNTNELPDCEVYIRDHYMTDSPGYSGIVAIIHWYGAPENIDVMIVEDRAWKLLTTTPSLSPHIANIDTLRAAAAKFRKLSEGDDGDAEHDAACELAALVEGLQ